MTQRRLAICADDLGLHERIARAVLALAERDRVQGVGCMVAAPAWHEARAAIDALHQAGVDVGLHLDLTEYPIDARFKRWLPRLIVEAGLGLLDDRTLEREIAAQIDRFAQQIGRAPDYIDGHRHVHQLPQVRRALLRVLASGPHWPWLRSTLRVPALHAPTHATLGERVKPWVIERLGARGLVRAAAREERLMNRRLLGVYSFEGDEDGYRRWIDAWLAGADDGDVMMCHPALDRSGAMPPSDDGIAAARAVEYRVLASDWMGQALARHGVTLAPIGKWLRGVSAQTTTQPH